MFVLQTFTSMSSGTLFIDSESSSASGSLLIRMMMKAMTMKMIMMVANPIMNEATVKIRKDSS